MLIPLADAVGYLATFAIIHSGAVKGNVSTQPAE
jgi:hypothetical protein